jgi:hypothetical protein
MAPPKKKEKDIAEQVAEETAIKQRQAAARIAGIAGRDLFQ